jgi:hypothetical protein
MVVRISYVHHRAVSASLSNLPCTLFYWLRFRDFLKKTICFLLFIIPLLNFRVEILRRFLVQGAILLEFWALHHHRQLRHFSYSHCTVLNVTFMVPCITSLVQISFQRDATLSSLYFISYRITLHVSGALCALIRSSKNCMRNHWYES